MQQPEEGTLREYSLTCPHMYFCAFVTLCGELSNQNVVWRGDETGLLMWRGSRAGPLRRPGGARREKLAGR